MTQHQLHADPEDLTRSLEEQLQFRRAQGLLAGMSGCSERQAAQALLRTAAHHGLASQQIGATFLAALDPDPDQSGGGNRAGRNLVNSVVRAALPPSGGRFSSKGDGLSVIWAQDSDTLMVDGELDLATGPLLLAGIHHLGWGPRSPGAIRRCLRLDLRLLTFIDVRGVDALTNLQAYVDGHGGQLRVMTPLGRGPCRVLRYAVRSGWLAKRFAPGALLHTFPDDIAAVEPHGSSAW